MKIKRFSLLLCLLSILVAGCGAFDENSNLTSDSDMSVDEFEKINPEMENSELITVGFSQLGSESVWRAANSESIKNALTEEKGFSLEFSNARQKQENQIKAIRGFISQRVDYIAFAAVTEEGWDTVLKEAKDAEIPVILVDRKINTSDQSLFVSWIGSDAKAEGERAGLWLKEYLIKQGREKENINIVMLQGNIGSSAERGRTQGFNAIAYNNKNWNILDEQPADFTTAKGKEVMLKFLEDYSDIDVVVSQNDDMTFGAIEAMKEKGISYGEDGDVIVISFDAVHAGLELVQSGEINVDIECNPEEGEYIANIIKKLENGEKVKKENVVNEKIFTKENVDKYINDRTY